MSTLAQIGHGLAGEQGTLGIYAAVQRLFVAFGCFALPGSLLIDAPFGRFGSWGKRLTVNGNLGWFLMELAAPVTFLYSLSVPLSASPCQHLPPFSPTRILGALTALPPGRQLLAAAFLLHYLNRAVLGSLRNPGRAPMHLVIPILSALFNVANGGTIGAWLAAGASPAAGSSFIGLRTGGRAGLFGAGVALWAVGFAGNIYHDEILYDLKRAKQRAVTSQHAKRDAGAAAAPSPRERYSIPTRGLYKLVSHPSYLCEWVEWAGFWLASLQLARAPIAAPAAGGLHPLSEWYLEPPALFLLQEVAAMLPRALSGHAWYRRTFGRDWDEKGARWAVIPWVC
ncbi:hypothetical protein JCM3770_003920 [Rhodotorula araucariae]